MQDPSGVAMPREGDIFRNVAVRMWVDEKVRNLSRPQPNGQSLWVACICGEQTDIIPGCFKIGEAGWAEQLEWPLEGFRKAFQEASEQGLVVADWKARLVWVPKGLKHNFPASPNVILHWKAAWELLPECSLKVQAWESLRTDVKLKGEAWLRAFDKTCPKPFVKASPNQNQQQKQEQKDLDPSPKTTLPPSRPPDAPAASKAMGQGTLVPEEPKAPPSEFVAYCLITWKDKVERGRLEDLEATAKDAYPGLDLLQTAKAARVWEVANPKKARPNKLAWLRNWFTTAQEDVGKGGRGANSNHGGRDNESSSRRGHRPGAALPPAPPGYFQSLETDAEGRIVKPPPEAK
jgi:hypothetical protein